MMMNTANKLTLLRIAMIPVFLLVLYFKVPYANYWALGIFVAASLTDTLDGYIARHYNQITDFGKFMDPLADKMLVVAALLWFVDRSNARLGAAGGHCAGVRGERSADDCGGQGACDCRRLVRQGQDCQHDGVHRSDVPAH